MGQWEPLKEKFSLSRAVIEWEKNRSTTTSQFGDYMFYGSRPAPFYAFVHWHRQGTHNRWVDGVSLTLDDAVWKNMNDSISRLIQMFKGLASLGDSMYGNGHHESEFEAKGFTDRRLPNGQLSRESISLTPREGVVDLYWLNYFGKVYVDLFGDKTLASIKCTQRERVENGFLLAFAKDPFLWNDPKTLEMQMASKVQLDHEAFFDRSRNIKPNLGLD